MSEVRINKENSSNSSNSWEEKRKNSYRYRKYQATNTEIRKRGKLKLRVAPFVSLKSTISRYTSFTIHISAFFQGTIKTC